MLYSVFFYLRILHLLRIILSLGYKVLISACPKMQWYCRLVTKNSVLDSWACCWDSLILETASPRTHKPKIVNESLVIVWQGLQWFIYNFGLIGPGTRCFPYQWVQLQTYESRTLFFMINLQYHCILGLAEMKTLHPRDKIMNKRSMQDAQVKLYV